MTRFNSETFSSLLDTSFVGRNFEQYQVVSSTMDIARERSLAGCAHGTIVLAEEQSAGRGRQGRSFYSPDSENLYFTVVLRLSIDAHALLSIILAVSTIQACRAVGVGAAIKWPNDIFIEDKKVAGMIVDAEIFQGDRVALAGIGINVNGAPNEHPDLKTSAISLKQVTGLVVSREQLLASFCNSLEKNLGISSSILQEEYRKHSFLIGRSIRVKEKDTVYEGIAVDIAQDGGLIVQIVDEENPRKLIAAEVSIQPNY